MTDQSRERLRVIGSAGPWILVFLLIGWISHHQAAWNYIHEVNGQQTREYLNSIERLDGARIVTDADGVIREWNAETTEILGYDATEALGKNIDFLIPAEMRDAHSVIMQEAMKAPTYGKILEVDCLSVLHKNGEPLHISIRVRIERRKGEPVAIATFDFADRIRRTTLLSASN